MVVLAEKTVVVLAEKAVVVLAEKAVVLLAEKAVVVLAEKAVIVLAKKLWSCWPKKKVTQLFITRCVVLNFFRLEHLSGQRRYGNKVNYSATK